MPVAPPSPALASKRVPTYDTAARPLAEEHGAGRFLKLRPRLLRQLRKSGSPLFPAAQDLQVSAAKPRPPSPHPQADRDRRSPCPLRPLRQREASPDSGTPHARPLTFFSAAFPRAVLAVHTLCRSVCALCPSYVRTAIV